ncbi:MAG: hypothetical protein SF162_13200 [bacterium]|nr:hypothetical protein [bacterium]
MTQADPPNMDLPELEASETDAAYQMETRPVSRAAPAQPEPPPPVTVEPIPAEQARILLERAIRDRCGADWRDEDSGWIYVTGHDYMARMTKGRLNVDFYVDLLGQVSVTETPISRAQDIGRMITWILLVLSLGIAYLMARAVGWL